jgi:long-chain acyl-CoA synthetase
VAAVIVREAGSAITPAELEAKCLGCIARFKRPRHYAFVGFLPKNAYGKVAKRDVLAMLATQALLNPI